MNVIGEQYSTDCEISGCAFVCIENSCNYSMNGMVADQKRALTIKLQIKAPLAPDARCLGDRFARKQHHESNGRLARKTREAIHEFLPVPRLDVCFLRGCLKKTMFHNRESLSG